MATKYEMHQERAVHRTSYPGPCRVGHIDGVWYVFNDKTRTARKIGPSRMSGTNYYDKAVAFAEAKNREYAGIE